MIYVNCDASYHNGWAGIAYQSDCLESQSQLVECKNNSEAELRALLLAMSAAEEANLRDVIFRTDCESAARPHTEAPASICDPWRAEACLYLAAHQPRWSIAQVTRAENVLAYALARKARRFRDDVSVSLDTHVTEALIERAGIAETPKGRWRVAPDRHATSISVALDAALVKLATGAPQMPQPDHELAWAMYYVVRSDRRLSFAQAMALGGAGAVGCADRFRDTERWAANFAAWQAAEYPKVALRATADQFGALAGVDAAPIPAAADPIALCLPPRRKSDREPELVELAPFTDAKLPAEPPATIPGALVYVIRPGVIKSMGKAIAQAGHAALAFADERQRPTPWSYGGGELAGCPGRYASPTSRLGSG